MHVFDIEEAVEGGDRVRLQHAFRVLVSFPKLGHIEGIHSAVRIDKLYDNVVSALQFDQTIMPAGLLETLQAVTSVSFESDATYCQGALVASEFRERWQELFILEMARPRHSAA